MLRFPRRIIRNSVQQRAPLRQSLAAAATTQLFDVQLNSRSSSIHRTTHHNMPLATPLPLASLEALAAQHGTPFQLYDERGIRSNAASLIRAFGSHFPGFRQFYAVKALPNPAVLALLLDEGCGLDCSSTAELHIAQLLGVPGSHIMYTSNYTSRADLAVAFDQGVIINLDDVSLVDALVSVRGRVPDLICFRLNPGLGTTDSETASNVLGGPGAKFGVPPFQIVEAYRRARDAGATRFGIHMMTGSCVLNAAYWGETVCCVRYDIFFHVLSARRTRGETVCLLQWRRYL